MEDDTDYSQYAGDVKGQANLTVGQMFGQRTAPQPQNEREISQQLTGNPFAHVGWGATQEYRKARAAYGQEQKKAMMKQQEAANNADFRIGDAKFYAGIGDYSAVESVIKSKGPALFQIGEAIDFDGEDDNGRPSPFQLVMAPKGSYGVDDGQGGVSTVPAYQIAKRMGVKTVPFKGGDVKAQEFRSLATRVQKFYSMSNQLRKIYKGNTYLGSLDPSNDAAQAKAIESNLKMDYLSIMKDMKGMGGNVSDNDMAIAESMVPQRASTMFGRLGGNELVLLDNVQENVFEKLKGVAGSNGIDLIDSRQDAKKRRLIKGTVERR